MADTGRLQTQGGRGVRRGRRLGPRKWGFPAIPREALEEGGEWGGVYEKWPDKIFPGVTFVFPQ